jgi:hypothetical protein
VALEERGLRLDDADRAVRRLEDDVREALEALGVVGQLPPAQHRAVRVGAENERAVTGTRPRETGGERLGHTCQSPTPRHYLIPCWNVMYASFMTCIRPPRGRPS